MARRLVVGNQQLASVEDVCSPCLRTHDIISGSTRWLGSRSWQPDTFRPLCRARSGRPPVRDCSLRKRPLRARGTRSRPSVGAWRWCESTSPTSSRANEVRPVAASCSTVAASLFCTTSCLRLAFTAGPTRVVSGVRGTPTTSAPLAICTRVTLPWFSSAASDFNVDFGVTTPAGETSGTSVFLCDGEEIFHTYFTSGRGDELLGSFYAFLDLTPL